MRPISVRRGHHVAIVRPHRMKNGQVRGVRVEYPFPALKKERWCRRYINVIPEEWHRALLEHRQIGSIDLQLLCLVLAIKRVDAKEVARNPEWRESRRSYCPSGER